MDAERFDRLAALFARKLAQLAAHAATRRGMLGAAAAILGLRLAADILSTVPAEAKKGKKGKKGKKKKRNRRHDPDAPQSCALQPYNAETLVKRGLTAADTSNITFADIPPTDSRPHYDRVDVQFFTGLAFINACARTHNVTIRPYSAYRSLKKTKKLKGVSRSNHRSGHAIDMKVDFGGGICWWSECSHTGCLGTEPPFNRKRGRYEDAAGKPLDPLEWSDGKDGHGVSIPGNEPDSKRVRAFIDCVRQAPSPYGAARRMRWGGNFLPTKTPTGCTSPEGVAIMSGFDPIHFDDGLNDGGPYATRLAEVDKAAKFLEETGEDCPIHQICNLKEGLCECGMDDDEEKVCTDRVKSCCSLSKPEAGCTCMGECCRERCPSGSEACLAACTASWNGGGPMVDENGIVFYPDTDPCFTACKAIMYPAAFNECYFGEETADTCTCTAFQRLCTTSCLCDADPIHCGAASPSQTFFLCDDQGHCEQFSVSAARSSATRGQGRASGGVVRGVMPAGRNRSSKQERRRRMKSGPKKGR